MLLLYLKYHNYLRLPRSIVVQCGKSSECYLIKSPWLPPVALRDFFPINNPLIHTVFSCSCPHAVSIFSNLALRCVEVAQPSWPSPRPQRQDCTQLNPLHGVDGIWFEPSHHFLSDMLSFLGDHGPWKLPDVEKEDCSLGEEKLGQISLKVCIP